MAGRVLKSTALVAGVTLFSSILGFVRDMLIARIFGADWATDAFFVAFKVPNFLRRLFTEGAVNLAGLPILAACQSRGGKVSVRLFLGKAAGTLALLLTLVSLLGMLAAPVIIVALAPGFAWQGQQHALAVQLLQICWPYLVLVTLVALAGCAFNAYGRFAVPALMPVLLNVAMIASALVLSPRLAEPISGLAWGVLLAGVLQLLVSACLLAWEGLLPRLRVAFHDAGVTWLLKNLLPSIFSVSMTQLNVLLDALVASLLAAGSVSWLYYSDRLVEFPLGILGGTFGTVMLPRLARSHATDNLADFSKTLDWGLRWVLLVGVPAMLGLILLAEPVLSALFQYQEFTVKDVQMAGQSLKGYALGLLGYLLVKVLVPGFTTREDFKTPVRYGIFAMLLSLALNVLAWPLAHAGLALATSLGALCNAWLLLGKLRKNRIYRPQPGWRLFLLRVACASLVMAVVLFALVEPASWYHQQAMVRVVRLLFWVLVGMAVYLTTLAAVGLRPRHLALLAPS